MNNPLPYVHQILNSRHYAFRPNTDYDLGASYDFDKPMRPQAQFPQGFEAMGNLVTHGRFYILTRPFQGSSFIYGTEAIPYFDDREMAIYMPRAPQFLDDISAWHALWHESAHYVHHEIGGRAWAPWGAGITDREPRTARPYRESIAEIAAYAGMMSVGLAADLPRSASYAHEWLAEGIRLGPKVTELAVKIATKLGEYYTRALETTYVSA